MADNSNPTFPQPSPSLGLFPSFDSVVAANQEPYSDDTGDSRGDQSYDDQFGELPDFDNDPDLPDTDFGAPDDTDMQPEGGGKEDEDEDSLDKDDSDVFDETDETDEGGETDGEDELTDESDETDETEETGQDTDDSAIDEAEDDEEDDDQNEEEEQSDEDEQDDEADETDVDEEDESADQADGSAGQAQEEDAEVEADSTDQPDAVGDETETAEDDIIEETAEEEITAEDFEERVDEEQGALGEDLVALDAEEDEYSPIVITDEDVFGGGLVTSGDSTINIDDVYGGLSDLIGGVLDDTLDLYADIEEEDRILGTDETISAIDDLVEMGVFSPTEGWAALDELLDIMDEQD